MNPFTSLLGQLETARSGNPETEALKLLAPFWAAEGPSSGFAKQVVLNRLSQERQTRLVKGMVSYVNSLKTLNYMYTAP